MQGSPLTFRCSQGLPEYLSEEDDIMIAPRMMAGVIKSFLARVELGKLLYPPNLR